MKIVVTYGVNMSKKEIIKNKEWAYFNTTDVV